MRGWHSTLAALAGSLTLTATANAQYFDETLTADPAEVGSPEMLHLELRVGPYEPSGRSTVSDETNRFDDFFGGDIGPLLAVEVDAILYRLPKIASFGVGTGIGWAFYSGAAQAADSETTVQISEETDFTLYPVPILAFAKVDVLPRLLSIPLVFTVKLGADLVFWQASTGGVRDAENLSVGFRWALQAALELDWFERRAARSLDEEFGINHTYLFFEIFGSTAGSDPELGPDAGWAWTAGLGFTI